MMRRRKAVAKPVLGNAGLQAPVAPLSAQSPAPTPSAAVAVAAQSITPTSPPSPEKSPRRKPAAAEEQARVADDTPAPKVPRPQRRVNQSAPGRKVDNGEDEEPGASTSADRRRLRTLSTASTVRSSKSTASARPATTPGGRKKRQATVDADEELDTKRFLMSDLIVWKPKTENTMRKKRMAEKRQQALEAESNASESSEADGKAGVVERAARGPRVKINDQGAMVIDEDSLVMIDRPEDNKWHTVHDDLQLKKITSMSFRKNTRAASWTHSETDLFYEVLAATGTDFYLMHDFIPTRNRSELKKKFNREEKVDLARINETLRNPAVLNLSLHERIEKYKQLVIEESEEKAAAKIKKADSAKSRGQNKAEKTESQADSKSDGQADSRSEAGAGSGSDDQGGGGDEGEE